MEEHRLKVMNEDYNQELFNKLFKETSKLRNKLASEISLARFPGMELKDIKSWFEIKFLYTYQKYQPLYNDRPNILLGNIIKSLQLFKCRILRHAYGKDIDSILGTFSLDNCIEQQDWVEEKDVWYSEELLKTVYEDLKHELSQEAYNILMAQIYPPDYILDRITVKQKNNIPSRLLAEYFEVSQDDIAYYRKHIRKAIARVSLKYKLKDVNEI